MAGVLGGGGWPIAATLPQLTLPALCLLGRRVRWASHGPRLVTIMNPQEQNWLRRIKKFKVRQFSIVCVSGYVGEGWTQFYWEINCNWHSAWSLAEDTDSSSPEICELIYLCCPHPDKQARIRGSSSYHIPTWTSILQRTPPLPPVYNRKNKFGKKKQKGMSSRRAVKSVAEQTKIKVQIQVCAKDRESLRYSCPRGKKEK